MLDAPPHICPPASHTTLSDTLRHGAPTDSDPVMADQTAHHVVNSDRSTAEQSSVDAYANQIHQNSAQTGDHSSVQTTTSTSPSTDNHAPAHEKLSTSERLTGDTLHAPEPRPNGVSPLTLNGGHDANHSADEGNAGSDTDISRAGSVDQSKEENRHLKAGSAKKPTSFKSVSITKTFLAKTAGVTPPPARVGEKSPVASTVQPVAKPRLVAKSGSGLRDIPRVRSGDGASAPDGRTVWNKNQPVPLPPPKQFTDEELKQQYGIHLASRLQEDEQDGKSKWADEDDDEDDWAPETVEWMDGTKSTAVKPADQLPATPEPPKPAEPAKPVDAVEKTAEETAPVVKPTLTALKRPVASTSSTTKTILRPGAAQQARQNGLGSMGSAEKQTLASKAAPTQIKSPWAQLPPVDKAPPVIVNPPSMPQQPPRFAQRDPHGFDGFHSNAQPEPAREIATDTFDRSTWRESERANRELFNSQSGRYEPAPEYRRGSRQQDSLRQPAVLQRASHQTGASPAEPSAAFQTRSSVQQDSSYSRRRGSSVSGGSAYPRDRRMSAAKSFDLPLHQDEGRTNSVADHDVGPIVPVPEIAAQPLPQQDAVVEPPSEQAPPASTLEDEVARQKKVLQESREAAKRRKQEEWEREEAEKKERIRKRLEALAAAAPKEEPPKAPEEEKVAPAVEKSEVVESPEVSAAEPESQVSSKEQQASPIRLSPRKQRLVESAPAPFGHAQTSFARTTQKPVFDEPQLPGLKQHSPQMSTRTAYQRQPSGQNSAPGISGSSFSSPGDHKAQPVRTPVMSGLPSGDSFPLWNSGGLATHSSPASNVWGPPTNNRGIGNGTFETGYTRLPSGQLQSHQNAPFAGPAPFGRQYAPRISPQGFGDQRMGPTSNLDTRASEPSESPQINGTSPLPETARPAYQPAPIAPPHKAGARMQHHQPRDISAWTNFALQADQKDRDEVERLSEKRRGPIAPQQRWTETYKQTQMEDGWLGGPRKLINTEHTVHITDVTPGGQSIASPAPPMTQTSNTHQISSPAGLVSEQRRAPAHSTVRLPTGPSEFSIRGAAGKATPVGVHPGGAQPLPSAPMTPTSTQQQSRFFPSALYGGSPPPEEADHPVFGGGIRHPHVRLPMSRPKVKLPPSQSTTQTKTSSVTMPQRVASYKVGAQPLVANQDWQARFNGLFGKAQINTATPPSPPKTPPRPHAPSPAIAAATKAVIDFTSSVYVSLPQTRPTHFEAVSKPGVDDIFDGELSFGSTPRVFLPRGARYPEPFNGAIESRQHPRPSKTVEIRSKAELPGFILENTKSDVIRMKLPKAWATAKEIPFQRKIAERIESQSRKQPTKLGKSKRHTSGANASGDSDTPKTASPTSRGAGSRNPSFQKGQTTGTEHSPKPTTPANGQGTSGDENAPKKSNWAKPARGGRGRNSSYKSRA